MILALCVFASAVVLFLYVGVEPFHFVVRYPFEVNYSSLWSFRVRNIRINSNQELPCVMYDGR